MSEHDLQKREAADNAANAGRPTAEYRAPAIHDLGKLELVQNGNGPLRDAIRGLVSRGPDAS
jgi:hypothetical protein